MLCDCQSSAGAAFSDFGAKNIEARNQVGCQQVISAPAQTCCCTQSA